MGNPEEEVAALADSLTSDERVVADAFLVLADNESPYDQRVSSINGRCGHVLHAVTAKIKGVMDRSGLTFPEIQRALKARLAA